LIARGLALLALVSAGGAAAAGPARVPFVGCASDGQQGPQRAPLSRRAPPASAVPAVPAAVVPQLAYYDSGVFGVLAPRGWHCFGLEGSNGSILIVTPERHGARDLLQRMRPLRGPAVQLSLRLGDTSGRFEVARVIARAFPAYMDFARRVAAEGIGDPLPRGPYRTDRMVQLGPNAVGYTTPAGREGLGTDSRLAANGRPIDGLAVIAPEGGVNLIKIDVRLPAAQAGLATPILNAELPRR
jgi:hypothetical protein